MILHHPILRACTSLLLVTAMALPRVAWADEAAWPFDPQERYKEGIKAFEVGEHALAIELWMDILSNPSSPELGGEMIRLIGENVVSGLEASLKEKPDQPEARGQAARFCSTYSRLHVGHAFSDVIEDACVEWSNHASPSKSGKEAPAKLMVVPANTRNNKVVQARIPLVERTPRFKAGIGLLFTSVATMGLTVGGIIAEGQVMRAYHTTIYDGAADTTLRDRADGWRTVAVVSGGLSLLLLAAGSVLCLTGTKSKKALAAERKPKKLSLSGQGFALRF